ncbi:MAG TPA: c-type cytochrome, partial [Levilinea sp.]|nr:c-type cytochrome [Levilinea sp.]
MKPVRWLLISILGTLALSACTLAGDIPPPPDYMPPAAQVVTTPESSFPLMPPDPARGKTIYETSCAPCHGETGLGDGPQAGDLPVQVPMIGSADVARLATPVDWFSVVTYGNIERFMPPFGGSLADRQRWDVVAYAFTLSMPQEQMSAAAAIYAAQCQDCHGEAGQGDGVQAVSQGMTLANWSDSSRLATLSNQDVWEIISAGLPGTSMPAFGDAITSDQRWALTSYVRSLSFAQPPVDVLSLPEQAGQADAAAVAEALPQASLASVRVNLINGSGGALPAGLKVFLTGYDDMLAVIELSGVLEAGNSYLFENVEQPGQRVYLASVEFHDLTFYSDILKMDEIADGEVAQVSVTVYESTTDTSQLSIDRAHVFLEFPEPGRLQIAQLFLIANPTRQVVVAAQEGQPVLEFELPPDAINLQFADGAIGERYIETANGFGDLASIAAGETQHQVLFAFELPYERKQTLRLKMPLDVRSTVVALPEIEGLRLTSPQLRESGQRQVEGASLRLYSASNLSGGSVLELTVSGRPGATPWIGSGPTGNLMLGAGLFVLVIVFGAAWLWRQRRQAAPATAPGMAVDEPEAIETLLDAILALDDQYR